MTNEVEVPNQREAARLLVVQKAIYDRLRASDDESRAWAMPAWVTGDNITAVFDGKPIGKVAREEGAVTASVTNWGDLRTWAEEHAGEDAWEIDRPYPSAEQVEAAVGVIHDHFDSLPVEAEDLAEKILRAAMEHRRLNPKKVDAWLKALKLGDGVASRKTGEVFDTVPGITVSTGKDKLVVRPNWAAVEPIVDRILSGPELKEITGG